MPSDISKTALTSVVFAQNEPLTTRLHGLIRSYPRGIGLVQEFVQNADDAGAQAVRVWLDERTHPALALPSQEMAVLQGTAVVVINDAEFSSQDWERLQTIGQSSKTLDSSKTGRFGLGFNSVYNVTDFPSVLSGDKIGIFDPHARTVQGATYHQPGNAWCLNPSLWTLAEDLVAPFIDFGVERGTTRFKGTIFRLPVRTAEQAEVSEICNLPFSRDDFVAIAEKLGNRIGELLLFLNSVTSIEFGIIAPDGARTQLLAVRTLNPGDVQPSRSSVHTLLKGDHETVIAHIRDLDTDLVTSFHHEIEVTVDQVVTNETWKVTRGLFRGPNCELVDHAERMYSLEEKAVPLAGTASLISSSQDRKDNGRVYCGLPLPSASPIVGCHIDGFFDLQADRQGLFEDREAEGSGAVRVGWNEALIRYGCAPALALHCLERAKEASSKRYQSWPTVMTESRSLMDKLPEWTYGELSSCQCIMAGAEHGWRRPDDVHLVPGGSSEHLFAALLADDFVIPTPPLPTKVINGFRVAGHALAELTPATLRDELREADDTDDFSLSGAPRPCLSKREWILVLLQHCVSDGKLEELWGVPLALLASRMMRAFGPAVYVAGQEERELFASQPGWFLDVEAEQISGLGECEAAGILRMTPQMVIQNLSAVLPAVGDDAGAVNNDPHLGAPTSEWLTRAFQYLSKYREAIKLQRDVIDKLPLVPDQFGMLRAMGRLDTPLLASTDDQHRLDKALKYFNVPIVSGDAELLKAIRAFVDAYPDDAIWRIEPRDLIDTLDAVQGPQQSEDDVVRFEVDKHGAVLDVLSRKHGIAALKGVASDRVPLLQKARLFSTDTGHAVSLDSGDYYVPADYHLPELGIEIGLLSTGPKQNWAPLLTVLGVPTLTRYRFIVDRLLHLLPTLGENDLVSASLWLRQNLPAVREEVDESQDEALIEQLKTELPVLCTDGERRPISALYHPSAAFVGPLLGDVAGFPDLEAYGERRELWLEFFGTLGMEETPRADDIVSAIDLVLEQESTDSSNDRSKRLADIAYYLEENWDSLRDSEVFNDHLQQSGADDWHLSDGLSVRAWLPILRVAPRGFPNKLLVRSAAYLAKPAELFARGSLDLVSCVHPVCALDRISRLGSSIGLQADPQVDDVVKQLELVCNSRLENGSDGVDKRVGGMLRSIYRFLGRALTEDEVPLDDQEEVQHLRAQVHDLFCVIDDSGSLHRPPECFSQAVPEFLGRAVRVYANEREIDCGLAVLGRRNTPDLEDYRKLFVDLHIEWADEAICGPELQMLRLALQRAAQLSEAGDLAGVPVLNATGRLSATSEIVLDDAPWLSDRGRAAGVETLDAELGREVAVAFGISVLSSAVYEKPVVEVESEDQDFLRRCCTLEEQLRSEEFMRGVERLLVAAGNNVRRGRLAEFFDGLAVVGVKRLETELVWLDGGARIEGSAGEADVFFDPERNALLASEAADSDEVLDELIADTLVRELEHDEFNWGDMGAKVLSILRSAPDRIQRHLDRLKVPRLPDTPEDVDVLSGDSSAPIDDLGEEGREEIEEASASSESGSDEVSTQPPDSGEGEASDSVSKGQHHMQGHGASTVPPKPQSDDSGTNGGPENQSQSGADEPAITERRSYTAAASSNQSESKAASSEISEKAERTTSASGGGKDGRSRSSTVRENSQSGGQRHPRSGERTKGRGWTAVTRVTRDNQSTNEQSPEQKAKRRKVDQAAIRRVLAFEQERGRRAKEMPHENQGYDVESYSSNGEIERYIEVKGLSGGWSGFNVSISRAQHKKASHERAAFWLYVVEFALEPDRSRVFAIQNPGELIDQYWFDDGWKNLSKEREGPGTGAQPTAGARVVVDGNRPGVVKSIRGHGALQHLKVAFDNGAVESLVYTPRRILVDDDGGDE